jgi:hypothetical protein
MNKKLFTYFREGKYWICHSQKLRITGYGRSKQDAYRLFMVSWNYVEYKHKKHAISNNSDKYHST